MRHLFHSIQNLTIYLVPTSLFATASVLLLALLYYPPPDAIPTVRANTPVIVMKHPGTAHADALFTAMLLDALRQLEAEEGRLQGQTLLYRHFELDSLSQEQPVIRLIPSSGDDNPLIRL